jgi:hypothetical protein
MYFQIESEKITYRIIFEILKHYSNNIIGVEVAQVL